MEYLALSFLAGILTVLAPCILPLLPVIIGGSISKENSKRPLIVTLSLAVSIIVFTLLLKVSTLLVDIPENFWTWFSASIITLFGLTLLFPGLWPKIQAGITRWRGSHDGLEAKSQKILFQFHNKKGPLAAIILGAALGPVFASCSPTYFLILSTVLPENFVVGLLNLIAYALGLALVMLIIAYAGQRYITTLNKAADPQGWFKRGLGLLFLIVAFGIATGYDKKVEDHLIEKGFNITQVEQKILNKKEGFIDDGSSLFNINKNAPDIVGLEHWINSEGYTSLEELKGKVILIDFWTYSCINCIRTLPYLNSWNERYRDDGLVILGIHTPEFAFERVPKNVENAVNEHGISYPVALDNNFRTWRNYENRFWPAKYLIDQEGQLRYYHFGEGDYEETELAITSLLGIKAKGKVKEAQTKVKGSLRTKETYLGTQRRSSFPGKDAQVLQRHEWTVSGSWDEDEEKIFSTKLPASLRMKFYAKEANLVLDGSAEAEIYIDGVFEKKISIQEAKLYNIYTGIEGEHDLEIIFNGSSIEAFAWTFG